MRGAWPWRVNRALLPLGQAKQGLWSASHLFHDFVSELVCGVECSDVEFRLGETRCSGAVGPCLAVRRLELGWGSCGYHGGRQVLGRFLGVVQTSAGKGSPVGPRSAITIHRRTTFQRPEFPLSLSFPHVLPPAASRGTHLPSPFSEGR